MTALSLMTASRPVFAATSDLATAISDLDRAEVLRDAGLTTEAETLLARVAGQFGAQRMPQARGEAEFHLSRSLMRHDPVAAERMARTAARRFAALGSAGWAARADAVRLESRLRTRPLGPQCAHRRRHRAHGIRSRTAASAPRRPPCASTRAATAADGCRASMRAPPPRCG